MKTQNLSYEFFTNNRRRLSELMTDDSIAIIHSNDEMPRNGDQFFPFRQNSSLFYLTGINQERTVLVLCPNHPLEKMKEILFIRKRDVNVEIWEGRKLSFDDASSISGIKTVFNLDDMNIVLRQLFNLYNIVYFLQNDSLKTAPDFPDRNLRLVNKLRSEHPALSFKKLFPLITELRIIKSDPEIDEMKQACRITNKAFFKVLDFLKPGINECEIESKITYEFMSEGARYHAYHPIIASGPGSCVLHYTNNNMVCKDGDLLLLDFGAEINNYAADCSRTIPVNGKFNDRQRKCYESVLNVFKKLCKLYVPGNSINIINEYAAKYIEDELVLLGLLNRDDILNQSPDNPLYKKYFMHGTAHFIGLDVHDVGEKDTIFKKGMILTCEPGIYIREENIGIRIENNIVIDEKPIDLMIQIPLEIDEIESLMKN